MCDFSPINIDRYLEVYLRIEIPVSRTEKVLLTSIYRSPNSTLENNRRMNSFLREIALRSYTHYLTVGDLYFQGICWENYSTRKGTEECTYYFVETIKDCYWFQHITETTGERGTSQASLLDLGFHQ